MHGEAEVRKWRGSHSQGGDGLGDGLDLALGLSPSRDVYGMSEPGHARVGVLRHSAAGLNH
jgi:hypothetical protein